MGIGNALVSILNLIFNELQIPLVAMFGCMLAWNGYKLFTGNAQTVESVKKWIVLAFIGLILVLFGNQLATLIINTVKSNTTIQ